MKSLGKKVTGYFVLILLFFVACQPEIERSGIVLDAQSKAPIENARVEIYLAAQKKELLQAKVLTDKNGHFHITEKRPADLLFLVHKEEYIGYVSALNTPNDTILLEKQE